MTTALAVQNGGALVQQAPVGMLRPIASPQEVIVAMEETRALVAGAMVAGRDYGKIPGTKKPTLLKAGAERAVLAFGCYFGEAEVIEREIDHNHENHYTQDGQERVSYGLYRYVVRVPIIFRGSGQVVGSGVGACSTMESKYISRPRDCENTALKMAHKRAIVGAALVTLGLSDQFTQDVEDLPREMLGQDAAQSTASDEPEAHCPKCQGEMWDNRPKKKAGEMKPKAPDFKCKDKDCGGLYWTGEWPPKQEPAPSAAAAPAPTPAPASTDGHEMTLEEAIALPLLGGPEAWGGKGGAPIGSLTPKMLHRVLEWVQKQLLKKHDDTFASQAEAIALVLAEHERRSEPTVPAAPAMSKQVDMPPAGRQANAIVPGAHNTRGNLPGDEPALAGAVGGGPPSALQQPFDDLPSD